MAKCIMVQGTMSGAGKSLLVTGLCRVLRQEGLRAAPFKSQNMALNSYVTRDGLELGRAQAAQAEAAGLDCDVRMNPILLKPCSDTGSQLIVLGRLRGEYDAAGYYARKEELLPEVLEAYRSLAAENDVIVIEGAGSPAEINLRQHDIVNMGLAERVDAPVLLVGDIDRGGVFAQLYGTIALLQPAERRRVIGTVINKFRGDPALLSPGLRQLEELTKLPVLGVLPWLDVQLDDEDSLAPQLQRHAARRRLDAAVIRLPHIANFTDFPPLEEHPDLGLRYVSRPEQLGRPDLLILPGSKSSMADLCWLRESGLAEAILARADEGMPILGVCGGYQMLGERLDDPQSLEGGGSLPGLGLLPCRTVLEKEKTLRRREGRVVYGPLAPARLEGYEIHMGRTEPQGAEPFCVFPDGSVDGAVRGRVFGTYLHGLFDTGELTVRLAKWLGEQKGIAVREVPPSDRALYRQRQYDRLAGALRAHLDLERIYAAMEDYAHDA